jgi:hypothetical protein
VLADVPRLRWGISVEPTCSGALKAAFRGGERPLDMLALMDVNRRATLPDPAPADSLRFDDAPKAADVEHPPRLSGRWP